MRTFWNIEKNLTAINEWQPNCWIQVTCPTDEDQKLLEEKFNIPDYFLSDISDTDERARYEYDDGWMLIILRIPYVKEIRSLHCSRYLHAHSQQHPVQQEVEGGEQGKHLPADDALARSRNRMGSASPSCVTHTELRMPLRPE